MDGNSWEEGFAGDFFRNIAKSRQSDKAESGISAKGESQK